jgi:gluconolactonase
MNLEVFEPELKTLIDPHATLEHLAGGFQFTEGPVWDPAQACLYFSDIPANTMYVYREGEGVQTYRQPSHYSNGLTLDGAGRLIACEHQTRRVTRTGEAGLEVVVDRYQGKRLNSPNDVVVAGDGSILFTDPSYGLREGMGGPAEQELPFQGVYRVPPGANEPILLADDFETPNGLAFNPGESRLYVDDTVRGHLRVFDVGAGWTLSGGDVLAELVRPDEKGRPDGLKVDVHGNIYCTGPGGIWVLAPDGAVLGWIHMPEQTANLNWGDADRRSLYITASTGLYRLRCLTQGLA